MPSEPYILVTTGGGGDGEALIDWVLRAYEHDPRLPLPGAAGARAVHAARAPARVHGARGARSQRVDAITFDSQLEPLVERAAGVVAMGGYNTFCEILSFDKRALIVPRTEPRLEQYIRAERAAAARPGARCSPTTALRPAR